MMRDLSPFWIKVKALLLLLLGVLSWILLFVRDPTLDVALFSTVAIWCFCRFYYFAFYVIERYVDRTYRFTGLLSFARYLATKKH
jgi:hypothetical protein